MKSPFLLILTLGGVLFAPSFGRAEFIYVTDDTSAGGLSVINTQTGVTQTITSPDLSSPTGIALDTYGSPATNSSYGDLFIANSGNDSIVKYDGSTFTSLGASPINLTDPQGMAFDSSGNLYVTSASYGGSVLEYTSGGTWVTYASSLGTPKGVGAPQGTGVPVGIAYANGILYVTEAVTGANKAVSYIIAQISKSGLQVTTSEYFPGSNLSLNGASGLAVYNGDLWVAQPNAVATSPSVSYIQIGGNLKSNFVVDTGADPQGIAFGASGALYVADYGANAVTAYDGGAGGIYGLDATYSGSGLQNPDFLVVDGNGINTDVEGLPIPEPGTWALLLGGVAMLYFRRQWAALRS